MSASIPQPTDNPYTQQPPAKKKGGCFKNGAPSLVVVSSSSELRLLWAVAVTPTLLRNPQQPSNKL